MDSWEQQHQRMSRRVDYDKRTINKIFRGYEPEFRRVIEWAHGKWGTDLYEPLTVSERSDLSAMIHTWIKSGRYIEDKQFTRYMMRIAVLQHPKRLHAVEAKIREVVSRIKIDQKPFLIKSLYQTWLDSEKAVARILNAGFTVSGDDVIYKAIARPFHGHTLFTRLWNQANDITAQFMAQLKKAINDPLSTLKSLYQVVRYYLSSGDYRARRLLVTESARINSEAKLKGFKKANVKYYQYVAVMDSRTTDICVRHDLKVYKVSEGKPGEDMPPLHPNCRSSVRPYFIDRQ